jgi:hypothetical protein
MMAVLLLTKVDGDENGVGHISTIAHRLHEENTIKDIFQLCKNFVPYRTSIDGVKMEILELKAQEEEK